MASSLIKINEATTDELCSLSLIGPRRAERIIRYRNEVAPIQSTGELATAAGISRIQAETFSRFIDFSPTPRGLFQRIGLPLLAISACIVFFFYVMMSGPDLSMRHPPETLFNASILVVLLAMACALLSLVSPYPGTRSWANLATWVLGSAGVTLILSLGLALLAIGKGDEFTLHVLDTWKYLLFVLLIGAIVMGPGWLVRLPIPSDASAMFYEHGQLLLLPVAAGGCLLVNSETLIEEMFALWAAVMLIWHGVITLREGSCFVASLSPPQRSLYFFLAREQGQTPPPPSRVLGGLLIASGVLLLGVIAREAFA